VQLLKLEDLANHKKDWLDFSSLSTFMRCPRQYYWQNELGIRPAEDAAALGTGKAIHEAKAWYYQMRASNNAQAASKEAALIILDEHMALVTNPDETRNPENIRRIMSTYFDMYEYDTSHTVSVEVPFVIAFDGFVFVGRIDRIVDWSLGRMVEETKSTTIVGSKWGKRLYPNLQVDGYVAAEFLLTGEMPWGAQLDIVPLQKPSATGKQTKAQADYWRPFRMQTTRNEADIVAWANDVQDWWSKITRCRDSNKWGRNTEACAPLLGFSCNYPLLCERYRDVPLTPEIELPGEYKVERWAPMEELL
jgi:hypothetical protein